MELHQWRVAWPGQERQGGGFCGLSLSGLKNMDGVSLRLAVLPKGFPPSGSR